MSTTENPHAGQGMVVLDIGGDIGALVISVIAAPEVIAGRELEICPTGHRPQVPDEGAGWWDGDWHSHPHPHDHAHSHAAPAHSQGPAWPHVGVIARPAASGVRFSAVFPGLRTGRYDLWVRPDGPTELTVDVVGGQVTEAVWPMR
jgi:hypothetical protein